MTTPKLPKSLVEAARNRTLIPSSPIDGWGLLAGPRRRGAPRCRTFCTRIPRRSIRHIGGMRDGRHRARGCRSAGTPRTRRRRTWADHPRVRRARKSSAGREKRPGRAGPARVGAARSRRCAGRRRMSSAKSRPFVGLGKFRCRFFLHHRPEWTGHTLPSRGHVHTPSGACSRIPQVPQTERTQSSSSLLLIARFSRRVGPDSTRPTPFTVRQRSGQSDCARPRRPRATTLGSRCWPGGLCCDPSTRPHHPHRWRTSCPRPRRAGGSAAALR
jgi:hypothetical protein